eukprot:COSAG02_NODE_1557_length_11939_cov_343.602872_4_plen_37_part_00
MEINLHANQYNNPPKWLSKDFQLKKNGEQLLCISNR